MTVEEMSNEFDLQLNAYNNKSFGDQHIFDLTADEYEKSVWLTKAQEDIVLELYSGRNTTGDAFEQTQELRVYLANLVRTTELTELKDNSLAINKLKPESYLFKLPADVWFITYESAYLYSDDKCINGTEASVLPVTQDELTRIYKNPFKGPSKDYVLRLDISNNIVELISKYYIQKYKLRYVAHPKPIVLVDLHTVSIDGYNTVTPCELDESLQCKIIERACKLFVQSKAMSLGQNSNDK